MDMSKPGFAFKANPARFPCSNMILPTAAIMAALSVHKSMAESQIQYLWISSNAALKAVRNPLLAATPPANNTCFTGYCLIALSVFVTSTSTTLA